MHNLTHPKQTTSAHVGTSCLCPIRLQQSVLCTWLYVDSIHGDAAAMQAIIEVLHQYWPVPLRAESKSM